MDPVIQLIHDRIQGRKDDAVLSLVIGGGAMRGAIAGGMLSALEQAGASDVFDHVYGASAGATNGAIFLAHQCRVLLPVFLRKLASRRFIRMTPRGLYADIAYVYEILSDGEARLDVSRIAAHASTLHIAVTDAETGTGAWFTNHDRIDILAVLKASAALPAFYNKPVALEGKSYLDGGVVEPLPVAQAIRDGATHVLVLATVPETYRAVNRHPLIERWARRKAGKFGSGFQHSFAERYHAFNRSLDLAFARTFLPPGVVMRTVAPRTLIGWAERRQNVLARAIDEGMREMKKILLPASHHQQRHVYV